MGRSGPGAIDQNPPHRLSRRGDEMAVAIPAAIGAVGHPESDLGLVDKRRRAERVIAPFLDHHAAGDLTEFAVQDTKILVGRRIRGGLRHEIDRSSGDGCRAARPSSGRIVHSHDEGWAETPRIEENRFLACHHDTLASRFRWDERRNGVEKGSGRSRVPPVVGRYPLGASPTEMTLWFP